MPRGFTANQTLAIDQKLINAAMSMIHETGVRKTTINQLTRAAHISVGAFYNFYPSKEALFFKVYEILEERVKTQLLQQMAMITEINITNLKEIILNMLASENMHKLLTIMQKEELDYILFNIDPVIINKHQQDDHLFIETLIKRFSDIGLKTRIKTDLILAYTQALCNLCYEKDQFIPYSNRIIDSFLNAMLEDLLQDTSTEGI
ncbi:MAG: TetR/AcrR family transcriptional regulator [Anaerolineaceae bacterium]